MLSQSPLYLSPILAKHWYRRKRSDTLTMVEYQLSTGLKINWQGHERFKVHSSPFYICLAEIIALQLTHAWDATCNFSKKSGSVIAWPQASRPLEPVTLSFSDECALPRLRLTGCLQPILEVISLMKTPMIGLGHCHPEDVRCTHCTHTGNASSHCKILEGQLAIFSNPSNF